MQIEIDISWKVVFLALIFFVETGFVFLYWVFNTTEKWKAIERIIEKISKNVSILCDNCKGDGNGKGFWGN